MKKIRCKLTRFSVIYGRLKQPLSAAVDWLRNKKAPEMQLILLEALPKLDCQKLSELPKSVTNTFLLDCYEDRVTTYLSALQACESLCRIVSVIQL